MVQSTVQQFQPIGVVGDIVIDGPRRGQGAILDTPATPGASANVIGRAFTHLSNEDLKVRAGGTGAFAGILANSKVYDLRGTTSGGTLAPSLTLPNEVNVELLTMTSGVLVRLVNATAVGIGYSVSYADADGQLQAYTGATVPADHTQIPNAVVVYHNIPATTGGNVLAVIALTGVK